MPRYSARRNKEKRRELERERDIEIIQRRLVEKERRGSVKHCDIGSDF